MRAVSTQFRAFEAKQGKAKQLPAVSSTKDEPVTGKLRVPEKYGLDGLTPKQYRFATLSFSGLSNVDAYRAAYNCEGANNHTVSVAAGELMENPVIIRKIRDLRLQAEEKSTLSALLSRNFVLNGLMRLATGAEKESVQLGALQTLGKTVGIDLFRDIHVTERVTRTPEDVERELKEKLDAMRAGLTIEGKASPVAPARRERKRKTGH